MIRRSIMWENFVKFLVYSLFILFSLNSFAWDKKLKQEIIQGLIQYNVIKTNVNLPDGSVAPFYIDLRNVLSYPDLSKKVTQAYREMASSLKFNHVVGAPIAGIALASKVHETMSDVPMLILRKEKKGYGTNKLIEGSFQYGDSVLVIDDVINSGDSVIKTIAELKKEGLETQHVAVLVDKQTGGVDAIQRRFSTVQVHTYLKFSEIQDALLRGTASPSGYTRLNFPTRPIDPLYSLEASNAEHYEGKYLKDRIKIFEALSRDHGREWEFTDRFFDWIKSLPDSQGQKVHYMNTLEERESLRINFSGNIVVLQPQNHRIYSSSPTPLSLIWVMDSQGEFYAAQKDREGKGGLGLFQHSSFFSGGNVAAAGRLELDSNLRLVKMDSYSGHYRTRANEFANALFALQTKGVDLSKIEVATYHTEESIVSLSGKLTAEVWLNLFNSQNKQKFSRFAQLETVSLPMLKALREKVKNPTPDLFQKIYALESNPTLEAFARTALLQPELEREILKTLQSTSSLTLEELRTLPFQKGHRIRRHFSNYLRENEKMKGRGYQKRNIRWTRTFSDGVTSLLVPWNDVRHLTTQLEENDSGEDLSKEIRFQWIFTLQKINPAQQNQLVAFFSAGPQGIMLRVQNWGPSDVAWLAEEIQQNETLLARIATIVNTHSNLNLSISYDSEKARFLENSYQETLEQAPYKVIYYNTNNSNKKGEIEDLFREYGVRVLFSPKTQNVDSNILTETTRLHIEQYLFPIKTIWTDSELDALEGHPAVWECTLSHQINSGEVKIYRGVVKGYIGKRSGAGGFGFDPYFIPNGARQTLGELKERAQSARALAVQAFMNGQVHETIDLNRSKK